MNYKKIIFQVLNNKLYFYPNVFQFLKLPTCELQIQDIYKCFSIFLDILKKMNLKNFYHCLLNISQKDYRLFPYSFIPTQMAENQIINVGTLEIQFESKNNLFCVGHILLSLATLR